jgi:hypothetical protein
VKAYAAFCEAAWIKTNAQSISLGHLDSQTLESGFLEDDYPAVRGSRLTNCLQVLSEVVVSQTQTVACAWSKTVSALDVRLRSARGGIHGINCDAKALDTTDLKEDMVGGSSDYRAVRCLDGDR